MCPVAERLLDEQFLWFYHIAYASTEDDMRDIGRAVRKVVAQRDRLRDVKAAEFGALAARGKGASAPAGAQPMSSLGVIVRAAHLEASAGQKPACRSADLPLVGWMARAAAASRVDRLVVSTEDDEIADRSARPMVRRRLSCVPAALAEDFASSPRYRRSRHRCHERHRRQVPTTPCVLLQPTTPFVLPEHIDACLARSTSGDCACAFTARQAEDPPRWMFALRRRRSEPALARQGRSKATRSIRSISPRPTFRAAPPMLFRVDAMRAQNRIICDPATTGRDGLGTLCRYRRRARLDLRASRGAGISGFEPVPR